VATAAVLVTFVRWCYLVRAVGIPVTMRNSTRIGFLGLLFNLSPIGVVGGDLLKAVILDREYPGRRAKAIASVVVDRIVGLYVLFLVASAGILLTGAYSTIADRDVRWIFRGTFIATAVSTVAIAVAFVPGVIDGKWTRIIARTPYIGGALERLLEAMRMYRRNVPVLLGTSLLTVGVHCLSTLSIYLAARGLLNGEADLVPQFFVYPISCIANTVPLSAGPFEATMKVLYNQGLGIEVCSALAVPIVYRILTILTAAVGFLYYLGSRREVAEVMHEAETEPAASPEDWEGAAAERIAAGSEA
jgi:glycosyltransferase 2 family protein